jgi:hypothetical protein
MVAFMPCGTEADGLSASFPRMVDMISSPLKLFVYVMSLFSDDEGVESCGKFVTESQDASVHNRQV